VGEEHADESGLHSRRVRMIARAVVAAALVVVSASFGVAVAHADPNALWDIVSKRCIPDQQERGDPAPCALVDHDSALLKDLVGDRQFLLIPTAKVTGIESPELLAPDAPNYFAAAWRNRSFVDERAGFALPRDWMSLAINSEDARTQDQLHIHMDCVRLDVADALARHAADIGPVWAPFPVPLAGDRYSAIAVDGEDLAVNPFQLLADGVAGAREDMGRQTLVVVGAYLPGGRPGFVILADHVDVAFGDIAGGEALQDHAACPRPK
jgi:CDP-diacylglycerol pyrophosphatase